LSDAPGTTPLLQLDPVAQSVLVAPIQFTCALAFAENKRSKRKAKQSLKNALLIIFGSKKNNGRDENDEFIAVS
jgi:hypothetical protein